MDTRSPIQKEVHTKKTNPLLIVNPRCRQIREHIIRRASSPLHPPALRAAFRRRRAYKEGSSGENASDRRTDGRDPAKKPYTTTRLKWKGGLFSSACVCVLLYYTPLLPLLFSSSCCCLPRSLCGAPTDGGDRRPPCAEEEEEE